MDALDFLVGWFCYQNYYMQTFVSTVQDNCLNCVVISIYDICRKEIKGNNDEEIFGNYNCFVLHYNMLFM